MNRNRAIAILLLCIACAFVAIRVSIGNKDKRGGTTTGNETLKSTEKPVAVDFAGLKKLAGRDSEGAIMRMDRATCIAAIQSGAFNGKSDGLLEKLLSRLAVLDPLEALKLGSAMDPIPNIKIWLSDVQIERILSKHEEEVASWLSAHEGQTQADSSIKVRLLTGITFAKPSVAVAIYAARKKNFKEDDMGRVPIALATMLSKSPTEAFGTCVANYEDKSLQARYLKLVLQVGVPPRFEREIEQLVTSLPDDEVRKAAIEGLIYGYERQKSEKAGEWKRKLAEGFEE